MDNSTIWEHSFDFLFPMSCEHVPYSTSLYSISSTTLLSTRERLKYNGMMWYMWCIMPHKMHYTWWFVLVYSHIMVSTFWPWYMTLPLLVRASPPVLSMWPCTLKLDEEKSTYGIYLPFGSGKWLFSCKVAQFGSSVCSSWYKTQQTGALLERMQ